MAVLKVGLAVGRGTGPELAKVFEKILLHLADVYSVPVEIIRSSRLYHTYFSLEPSAHDPIRVQCESEHDVEAYESFCKYLVQEGSRVMFKTAINAQSLYLIRQHQEAIKIELFAQGPNALLLIRDQAQGFYAGSNEHDLENASVSKQSSFSKDVTGRIVSWSLQRAERIWGCRAVDYVLMVYKFHLFDGVMSAWAEEWSLQYGIKITFVQPDTANRNLLAYGIRGRQLMIAGNEWADIMHIMLLDRLGQSAPELSCTENVYLRDDLEGLTEYQTTHGSADDIEGHGVVNPSATIRAASKVLARHAGVQDLEERVDNILYGLARQKATTHDQGGHLSTDAVVDRVMQSFATRSMPTEIATQGLFPTKSLESSNVDTFALGKNSAVIVMDFQNDFVTAEGIGAHYRGDMTRMTGLATNIKTLISQARRKSHTVVFVRFLGDEEYQLKNWQDRDRALEKTPKCVAGSWGAELFEGIRPMEGERLFDKKAHFDAFMCEGFERYLVDRGIQHLLFLGVYLDVCVDSTARTAFQKGYYIAVASDCTTTLHLDHEIYISYMKRLYGARIITHGELMTD